MQKETAKKLSRTATATLLATSTIAVGLPANGAVNFKDVKSSEYYYSPVLELANNNIISGYGDGTFRPHNNVTRGEAAKMLALSLKLNVANAETSMFKDVDSSNIFYKYIAALANKGIINGYTDGTFRPNEIVQRGAMAKMVALGYEFSLANKINHPFKDVPSNYMFNPHIQTLLNLGITEGTSVVTFSPEQPVTRGQLATFISRANKANAGKPTYVVDNVLGNKIFINSVGYTVSPSLSYLVKPENKAALLGAHIEGTFNGTTITDLSKLTINATGNANSIYTFDGGHTTFNGTLAINGSYLRFQNWTLNGPTIVAETPRKSLANYNNRLANIQIAGLTMANIIDFTKPTNPTDDFLNGGNGNSNNGGLNPGGRPSTVYTEKLSPIYKYVDFSNATVRNLIVEQTRSFIQAQKTVPTVTVRRDVEEAEFQFNIGNLYLEGDISMQLYGTHDINTVYKNTYYSVYFNTDSHINTMIFDNSSGWVNLGDHVTLDKAIIPPNVTPNDIFDDYKNDNDKIGVIEDNTGEEVDRDPIENDIVPDVTPPVLYIKDVKPDSNFVELSVEVNEPGKLFYVVLPENEPEPSTRAIVNPTYGINGSVNITDADEISDNQFAKTFRITELDPEVRYKVYLVHVDNSQNFSGKVSQAFATKDGTPPTFLTKAIKSLPGGRRLQLDFKPSEEGEYYYFLREAQNVDNTVTVENIIEGAQAKGTVTSDMVENGYSTIIREDELGNRLKPLTTYVIYAVLVDKSGNKTIETNKFATSVRTSELDDIPPYVTGPSESQQQVLEPVLSGGTLNQFYLYFSEKVDKDAAQNVNNYLLSGTGIINIEGQKPITPSQVVYEESRNRVLITIPSLTGFVNGDTLRVTVLPTLTDLAENAFENITNSPNNRVPKNFADYLHTDNEIPSILDLSIIRNPEHNLAEVTYRATKAGTVYYMVLPTGTDLEKLGIDAKDFVDEFNVATATNKFADPNDPSKKIYLEGSGNLKPSRTAELGLQQFDYDFTGLHPNPFVSYDLYMVLRDRSGNLSKITSQTMVQDQKAPIITSFNMEAKRVSTVGENDTQAEMMIQSDERGTLIYRIVKKYVVDTPATGTTPATYKLNPLIYDANGNFLNDIPGTGEESTNTNAQKEQVFKDYFKSGVIKSDEVPLNQGLTTIPITGLERHEEYVAIAAVKDTFGNFTVLKNYQEENQPKALIISEFYTDHTKPIIMDNIVFRNTDDTYTITFSETIMRNRDPNNPLNEVSSITTSTDLSKILEIKGTDGTDITGGFTIADYKYDETSRNHNQPSKLIIKPSDSYIHHTIDIKMKPDVTDQTFNDNKKHAFNLNDFGKYVKRDLRGSFVSILHIQNTDNKQVRAIFDLTGTDVQFDSSEELIFYFTSKSATTSQEDINKLTADQVINDAIAATSSGGSTSTLFGGIGKVPVLQSRTEIIMNHEVKFVTGDYIVLVLEDKYGNRLTSNNKVGYTFTPPTN